MVLSVSVQAQLRRGEHIGLLFVQCWEKTALHSLCHRHGAPGRADPCAVLGKCDSKVARSLKPFFSCFSNSCRNLLMACSISSWSGLASMFSSSCGPGSGGRLRRRWVLNVPSSVTKTCIYHDIPGYFGISQVMFKIETSKHIKLGYLNLNMHIPI